MNSLLHQIIELFGKPHWSLIEAHQASTHLSIGLLLGAVLFDVAALVVPAKRQTWRDVAFWVQLFGVVLLAVTFGLGYFGNPYTGKTNDLAQQTDFHRNFGIASLAFFGVLTLYKLVRGPRGKWWEVGLYGLAALAAVTVLTVTGWMGGHIGE